MARRQPQGQKNVLKRGGSADGSGGKNATSRNNKRQNDDDDINSRQSKIDALLQRLYYDAENSASAFTGKERVYRTAKLELPTITRRDVDNWFARQLTYTLHKPARHNFRRNKTIVLAIDEQWQADLCDMTSRAKDNDGYTFLLTVIDCFSRFAWVEPLPNKSGVEILKAFKRILALSHRKPQRLQTDKGSEFLNTQVQQFLRAQNIEFFTTNSEMKAAQVERFNRTIKTRMFKHFTTTNTSRYVDVLQSLVDGYNHSYHRSIKMRPVDVRESDSSLLRQRLYATPKTAVAASKLKRRRRRQQHETIKRDSKTYKYAIGTLVRISKARRVFRKGYLPNWTEETFTVYNRRNIGEPFYYLRDYNDERIKGGFYEHELQPVAEQEEYRIETVLSSKRDRDGKTRYLVKWQGWPEKFNSWIEDLHRL